MNSDINYAVEYDNSARVENSDALVNKYITDAANFREYVGDRAELNLAYGPGERNMMDLFWPESEAGRAQRSPIVMFIHGGYWQRMDRSSFSHLANGLNARGIAVAMPSYTLCPDIKIDGIINEMRRACLVLFQTYRRRITVTGHSAGGHLAACMMATNWQKVHNILPHDMIASGLGLSGLYDLVPICHTPINEAMGMDEEQAISASPIRWIPEALQQFDAWVGGDESDEFHRQGRELSNQWNILGTPVSYVSVPGANHFTVVDEMVRPDSDLVERIADLVKKPRSELAIPPLDLDAVEATMNRFIEESMAPPSPDEEIIPDPQTDIELEAELTAELEAQLEADAASEILELDEETESVSPEAEESSGPPLPLALPPEAFAEPDISDSPEEEPEQTGEPDEADTATQKQAE